MAADSAIMKMGSQGEGGVGVGAGGNAWLIGATVKVITAPGKDVYEAGRVVLMLGRPLDFRREGVVRQQYLRERHLEQCHACGCGCRCGYPSLM